MRIKKFLVEGTFGATFANLQWGRRQANLYLPSLCVPRKPEAGARASEVDSLLGCPLHTFPFLESPS